MIASLARTTIVAKPISAVKKIKRQASVSLHSGMVFDGKHKLDSRIAKGGMSTIYLASDLHNNRKVVLKIVEEKSVVAERLIQEAQVFKKLIEDSHPLFPKFYGSNSSQGYRYIAMEYIPGPTLRALIRREEKLPLYKIIEITLQLCGLYALHKTSHIHRDLKPENVIINHSGATVLDFGISCRIGHQEKRGDIVGSVAYLSPEQARSEELDQRSDIYSLGLILYEMINKRNPMRGENASKTITNQKDKPFPLLEYEDIEKRIVPEGRKRFGKQIEDLHIMLRNIIKKMAAKDRKERYISLKQALCHLEKAHEIAKELAPYEKQEVDPILRPNFLR